MSAGNFVKDENAPNRFPNRRQFGAGERSPRDRFLLPVCLTYEEYDIIMGQLMRLPIDIWWRVFEATYHVNDPCSTSCYTCDEQRSDSACCEDIYPDDLRITYSPQNPFTEPDFVPDRYQSPPFYVVRSEDIVDNIVGTEAGDVLTTFERLPGFDQWLLILANGAMPSITIRVNGRGRLAIHLLSVPQGGFAVVGLDDDPRQTFIAQTASISYSDFEGWLSALTALLGSLGLPTINGSLVDTEILEFEIEDDEEHEIKIVFYPTFSLTNFIGYGGGLRKVTWCSPSVRDSDGDGQPDEPQIIYDEDCIIVYDPIIGNWKRYCPNQSSESGCCCCCCCCCCCENGETEMCCCGSNGNGNNAQNGATRVYSLDGQLGTFGADGTFVPLPSEAFDPNNQVPPIPDDNQEPAPTNACYKATGAWEIAEVAIQAAFATLKEPSLVTLAGVAPLERYYRQNYQSILDPIESKLIEMLREWDDEDTGEIEALETAYEGAAAAQKQAFICYFQSLFDGGARLLDTDISRIKAYTFNTGNSDLDLLLKQAISVPDALVYKRSAANFADSQRGDCTNCNGQGGTVDENQLPADSARWAFAKQTFAGAHYLGNLLNKSYGDIFNDPASPQGSGGESALKTTAYPAIGYTGTVHRMGALYQLTGDLTDVSISKITVTYRVKGQGRDFTNIVIGFGNGDSELLDVHSYYSSNQGEGTFVWESDDIQTFNNVNRMYIALHLNENVNGGAGSLEITSLTFDYSNPDTAPLGWREVITAP